MTDKRTWGMMIAAVVGTLTISAAAAKPASDVPVNLWFGNAAGDGITSDGLSTISNGVTADYIDGIQNVLAIIQGSGNFRFSTQDNTRSAAQRSVCVNFASQYPGPLPFGNGSPQQCVNVLQPMHAYATGNVSIQDLHYGQSVQKLTRFGWDDGGYVYRLGYGTDMDQNGVMDSPPVAVTCIEPQDPSLACSRWLLAPVDSTGTAAFFRFKLLRNGEGPAEFLGNYLMPFSQTFTRR